MPAISPLRLALAALASLAVLGGCRVPDTNQATEVLAPSYDQFKGVAADGALQSAGVSRLLERSCGTLDCHGQLDRPLRIYGQYGLRWPEDGSFRPGIEPTSEAEVQANYAAVVGLEPEVMSRVVAGMEPPTLHLLLLRKPLLKERHKGGLVFEDGAPADTCLTAWLTAPADPAAATNLFAACALAVQ